MKIHLRKILLIAVLLLPLTLKADYLFKAINSRDGLTSSQVNCVLKDSRGFMWFGTPAGLYRYDGYRFRHFQCDSQDGNSLPDSYIESIQEAPGGNLWIKTPAGYCIYEPQSESFERDMHQFFSRLGYKDVPSLLYIDRFKNLWGYISGQGVLCYNMQQQLKYFFSITDDIRGLYSGNICSIGECRDGTLIVYDDGRLVCCKVSNEEEVLWRNDYIAQQKLRKTKSLKVFADQKDNVWLYGQGTLFMYNKQLKTWNTQLGNELNLTGLGVDHAVNAMGGDRSGNVWIGTARHGLIRMNVNSLQMEEVPLKSMSILSRLRDNSDIRSIFIDDSDLLWVGTARAGVVYYGDNIYKFEAEMLGDITAICQDSAGVTWYGTSSNGIIGYEGPLASVKVSAIATTKDGSIWVGSPQNGLTRIRNGVATFYSTASDSTHHTMIDDHINAMTCDKQGNLWIATDGGLQLYNPKLNQFSNYTKEQEKIKTNNITSLFYSRSNKLLMGTSEGLIIMNISTGEMDYYIGNSNSIQKFTNNYITQVFEDSRGLIWVGTREGVNVLNLESDNLDQITEKNGNLCNNNICGIAEDQAHNIWLTTSNGVSRIVVQRNHEDGTHTYGTYNYTLRDGLQNDEFNTGAIATLEDGRVIMGGLNGVNWVRPKTRDEREALPPVILTELYIGEEEVLVGHIYEGKVPLPQALNEISRIYLSSDQNTFTIKFAAGSYNQSERLQFVYLLEGSDDETWHDGDAMKHGVTFTDLSFGTYKLHVKANNSAENINSDKERVIEIVIDRPFFLQYWMIIIYALVIAVGIYIWKQGIDHIRRLWKRKKAILGELVRQREEIKAASDELRQPMSRMTSIIMNLAERDTSLEEREQLNSLHAQMLQLITRVSDMQTALEHPEEKASQNVKQHYLMDGAGEMTLPDVVREELTSEIKPFGEELPTARFRVVFIDSNKEFIEFISARMKYIYDFHPYNDIHKAATDIEDMMPDLVVCKQDMKGMTGSELCTNIKIHPRLNRIKFVLMTDSRLSAKDMLDQGIAMSADDYLAKPFNLQEAVMRFNKLLGIGPIELDSSLIEGAATRMLEDRNSSMTTASETNANPLATTNYTVVEDDMIKAVTITPVKNHGDEAMEQNFTFADGDEMHEHFSMSDSIDRQLLNSIEQYVQQNMSRGTINLEDMAQAMGMAMKPFFQKVRDITGKTPAEVVRDIRLRHACILLQRTDLNMSVLANNVGFATGEHFIALFKERFGLSPSEYRLKYRK